MNRKDAKIKELTEQRESLLEEAAYYAGHRPQRAAELTAAAEQLAEEIEAWS